MVSRDYTKEVGLQTAEKSVSKPVAAVVFAILALGGWYTVHALTSSHHDAAPPPAQSAPSH